MLAIIQSRKQSGTLAKRWADLSNALSLLLSVGSPGGTMTKLPIHDPADFGSLMTAPSIPPVDVTDKRSFRVASPANAACIREQAVEAIVIA